MIDKIKELRKVLPIPIGEAKQLLMENEGDVEKCIYLFKAKSLNEIQDITVVMKKWLMSTMRLKSVISTEQFLL